jgi:predicted ATPase
VLIPVERQSHLEKALAYARRALEKEAWNEPAHQTIIEALSRLGKTSEAVAQYRACCRVLAKEFNLEPGLATTQIYQEAIHPLVTYPVQQIRGNLIPAATPFIGREPQIEKLEKLVHLYRWVTLVGEGGIGKTRLALHVAGGMAEQFNGGVWLVPLENNLPAGQTKISLHHQLTQALLSHIPILSGSEILTSARIISQIGMARMLVVFDGFEDFSDGADYILDLLANAPNLHVLVTTRQMIYFQTGYIMRVEGFPCPSAPVDTQTMLSPGVTLFLESSDRCGCSIPKTPENLSHIAHICRLLDGIPLAIELAAPWTLRLPLEKIAEYLETDLSILSSRYYDLPQRHSSMQAVFESSWKLLSPQAQVVLSMCADFPGEFSLHDVAGKIYQAEIDGLVDKSLLVQVSAGRYRLHQILRLFIKGQKCLLPIGT